MVWKITRLPPLCRSMMGLGMCWQCGAALTLNEVAGICPPCRWAWPLLPSGQASQALAALRCGAQVWGLGFRLCGARGTDAVVHRMKYGAFPEKGRALGHWMAQDWPAPPPGSVLVPVPLHWRRRARRGFNPSMALAEGLASVWSLPIHDKALRRVQHLPSLTASTRAARLSVLEGTYAATLVDDDGAQKVVLVDDVLTTGATFRMCRRALEKEGHEVLGGVWLGLA